MKKTTKSDANTVSSSQADDKLNENDNKNKQKSRRRLIQVLVAGGVVVTAKSVPSSWSRPVVKAVMLPAHAQTSLITLGNNGNFRATNTHDMEQTESLLASGIKNGWAEIYETLVQEAIAGTDDGQPLCEFTGCSRIEYASGANSGLLYIGIMDISTDSLVPTELVLNFTDGQIGAFNEPCLEIINGFRVDLISDNLAYLTIYFAGEKVWAEIDLVKIFDCMVEPVNDGG